MSKILKGTATKKAEEKKGTANTTNAENKKPQIKKVTELDEIKRELEKLKQENESLKNGKLKLSFADAEKLYKRKTELLRQLNTYAKKKEAFENVQISEDKEDIINAGNIRISFEQKESADYDRYNTVFKTSSLLILSEFVPFIISKLEQKIVELKKEVETIDI